MNQPLSWNVTRVLVTRPETNSSHLKIGWASKKTGIPTIHFQVRAVSFREGKPPKTKHKNPMKPY